MNDTFQDLTREFSPIMMQLLNVLATSRTADEVDAAREELKSTGRSWATRLKNLIAAVDLQIATDHSAMQTMLNDRFSLDPSKATIVSKKQRNTVRWEITLYGKEKYWYISKADLGVDMDKFYEWCLHMLT